MKRLRSSLMHSSLMHRSLKLPRRSFLQFAAAAAAAPALPRVARAEAYPSRPITMIVPFPPGGPTDTPGRVIAERMGTSLGQPVIVENVGGAEGSIGTGRVARANPDGYTIVLGVTNTHVMNGAFYSLPYDVLNDFAPISPLFTAPLVLYARKTLPANDLRELIAWLKANGDKATAGFGTATFQVLDVFFERETKTQFALIPYHGSAPGIQDLISGQIDLYFTTPVALSLVRAGSIKAFAVTSDTRLAQAPDIPTFAEMGLPSLSFSNWYGLFAPKDTPGDVVGRLNAAAVEALADPAAQTRLVDLGYQVFPRERQTPQALGAMQKADAAKWWPIIKEAGIKAAQ
jgi:tripartite-type tricarboxylate transporter receptor subunit TctC